MIRTYSELSQLPTFKERFDYLNLAGSVGDITFGHRRYLNQILYRSKKWKDARREVIIRDKGCDLGIDGLIIPDGGHLVVHHMNPITLEDVEEDRDYIYNPEYLITVLDTTHNAIHFGDFGLIPKPPIERTPNDTCPWRCI